MSKRTAFEVAYEGPAVDSGIMDVRELAPALLALGSLIENANQVAGDPEAQVKVVVKASFETGSFEISLEVIYKLVEQARLFLDLSNSNNLPNTLLCMVGLASGTGVTLISLIKWIRGRKIKNAVILESGNVRIEVPNEEGGFDCIECDEKVIRLYRSRQVREDLREVLSPLTKEGITGFSTRKNKTVLERISKEETPYYDVPEENEGKKSTTSTRKAFVSLVGVAFEEGLKWRFSDGENRFYATIKDEVFLSQMEAGKKFAKGDTLEVVLETTQTATSKGIKNEHNILEVIDHLTQPDQISLPFKTNDKQD